MSPFVPKPSSLVWYSKALLGFKMANLIDVGSYVGCLPTLVERAKSAGANLPEINGKIPFQSRLATPEGVDNSTDDAEILAIDPHGAELVRRTHVEIYTGKPFDRSEPRLVKGEAMNPADDEARKVSIRKGAMAEHSLSEVARSLAIGRTMSRRQVLGWIGGALAGAALARFPGLAFAAPAPGETSAGVPTQHGAMLRGLLLPKKDRSLEGRFGLMFKTLPAFEPPDTLLSDLASSRMKESSDTVPNDLALPVGFVFLGQFIDHDLTFDDTPIPAQREDPDARTNFRTPRFELDSVYGPGPKQDAIVFDPDDPAKLYIARNSYGRDDLPRYDNGTARIGDPRDDENLVTSQLHLAFRKFHNALVDHVREQGLSRIDEVFAEAQRLCRWHYQWVVVHDFLPRVVEQGVIDAIFQERPGGPAKVKLDFYKPQNPNKPMTPIEFAVAAYRFGHSMLRREYVINEQGQSAVLFGKDADDFPKIPEMKYVGNLNGGRPLQSELEIAWRHFFEIPGAGNPVNHARPIDSKLSGPLFTLPFVSAPPVSLAERNLLRGKRLGLASGQQVAQEMGVQALSIERLGLGDDPRWVAQGRAPLWFYILKEAELKQGGERLGAVGGRIVAEVFLGLLRLDGSSYLRADPTFRPKPPIAPEAGVFGMGDLLRFAGVA